MRRALEGIREDFLEGGREDRPRRESPAAPVPESRKRPSGRRRTTSGKPSLSRSARTTDRARPGRAPASPPPRSRRSRRPCSREDESPSACRRRCPGSRPRSGPRPRRRSRRRRGAGPSGSAPDAGSRRSARSPGRRREEVEVAVAVDVGDDARWTESAASPVVAVTSVQVPSRLLRRSLSGRAAEEVHVEVAVEVGVEEDRGREGRRDRVGLGCPVFLRSTLLSVFPGLRRAAARNAHGKRARARAQRRLQPGGEAGQGEAPPRS